MPRQCSICSHSTRTEIESALVAGTSLRDIAGQFGVSKTALGRHRSNHLGEILAKTQEEREIGYARKLSDSVEDLQARAFGILEKAEAADDLRTALAAIRELRGNVSLLNELFESRALEERLSDMEERLADLDKRPSSQD